jgi:hypothetical protein
MSTDVALHQDDLVLISNPKEQSMVFLSLKL